MMLLTEEERKHIKGIIINKFRGDIRLFEGGIKIIEELCKLPVLGVIPNFTDIYIEEEDSVALQGKNLQAANGKVNVAVILLRHLSNFTDFNVLEHDSRVHLYYTNNTEEVEKADVVIIPGSKSTLADLYELRRNGVAQSIVRAYKSGATVMGICGGFQLMGQAVSDPQRVEGDIERLPGLGLLPVSTQMLGEKVTRQVKFAFLSSTQGCEGYEIHMGETAVIDEAKESPVNILQDGKKDGYYLNDKCFGTYIHGILDNSEVVDFLLRPYAGKLSETPFDYKAYKEEQYNKLACHVRKHVDVQKVYEILTKGE
jgi:adenosylcobyric acid synthase